MFAHAPYDFAPRWDNVANGNISFNSLYRLISLSNNLFFPSDWAHACRNWLVQSHNRTATRLPARSVVDSLCCGKATVVETCHRHVSKSRRSV